MIGGVAKHIGDMSHDERQKFAHVHRFTAVAAVVEFRLHFGWWWISETVSDLFVRCVYAGNGCEVLSVAGVRV